MAETDTQLVNHGSTDTVSSWPDSGIDAAIALLQPATIDHFCVVDVGAHVGETLLAIRSRLTGSLTYIGLEPNPQAFEQLGQIRIQLSAPNLNIEIMNAAAGQADGRAIFKIARASAVSGLLEPVRGLSARVPSGDHEITQELDVALVTVETLANMYSLQRIDFLKVDAEGYDLEVLRGAQPLLQMRKIAAVMTEVFFVPYRTGQAYFWDIGKFMEDSGYHFVNLYDTRNTGQGRLYTGNALWVANDIAEKNSFL